MGVLVRGACVALAVAFVAGTAGCPPRKGWSHTASPLDPLTVHFCLVKPGTLSFEPDRMVTFLGPDGFKLGKVSLEQLDWLLAQMRSPAFQDGMSKLKTGRADSICAGEEAMVLVAQGAPRLLFRGEPTPPDPAVLELVGFVQDVAIQFGIAPLFSDTP